MEKRTGEKSFKEKYDATGSPIRIYEGLKIYVAASDRGCERISQAGEDYSILEERAFGLE